MNKIFFVTGASGAGKTTVVKNLEKKSLKDFKFFYFDSVGVPSEKEMNEKYGSGEKWQQHVTDYWIKEIKNNHLDTHNAILDGQMRISFIEESCRKNGVSEFEVILIHCSGDERKKRLEDRNQPELFNHTILEWANYLKNQAEEGGFKIIDNTNLTQEQTLEELKKMLK